MRQTLAIPMQNSNRLTELLTSLNELVDYT